MKVVSKHSAFSTGTAMALTFVAGLVLAQDTPPAAPAPAPASPAGQFDSMTASQMIDQATAHIGAMREVLKRVVELQEVARRQKDVIKLNCVNDKLLQVKQLLNIAEGANNGLHEAVARNDDDARKHEYGRIQIAFEQAGALATEAENCIGEDVTFLGPTEVTVEAPTSPEDMEMVLGPDFPQVEYPPMASPYI